ncbi:hypothetical protein STEG23_009659 [Scotinomys teguina]
MEVVAAAPRCQQLLIVLMAVMLLLGMKSLPLLVRRKTARTIELQENISKEKILASHITIVVIKQFMGCCQSLKNYIGFKLILKFYWALSVQRKGLELNDKERQRTEERQILSIMEASP